MYNFRLDLFTMHNVLPIYGRYTMLAHTSTYA